MLENERIIVDRGGIDPGIAALMQNANKGFDPAALMAMMNNGNGMFGGNGGWWWIFIIVLFWMWGGWGGNGFGRGNQAETNSDFARLAAMGNQNNNTDLLMQAINGNKDAINTLSTNLNCDVKSIDTALCSIQNAIGKVGGEVGFSAERVINAVNAGDCNVIKDIIEYLNINLKLTVKSNYQVFPLDSRGLDFVGYKFYHTHTLLRKSIKHRICKCLSRLYNKTYSNSYARRKVCSYFGWLKFCNSINFCKKLVLRVCKKYNLTTPEIFVPKKDIISNVLNRRLKFIDYKIYNKYFKLYVITNKLISVTSKSKLLLSLLIRDIINTYIIIIFHKRYNAYEILL